MCVERLVWKLMSNKTVSPAPAAPNPFLEKYNKLKKLGTPVHAIVNRMKIDGVDPEIIKQFESGESAPAAAGAPAHRLFCEGNKNVMTRLFGCEYSQNGYHHISSMFLHHR